MTDRTQEVLDLYEDSFIRWEDRFNWYCFYNEYKNFSIYNILFGLLVYNLTEDNIHIDHSELNHYHPEIIKIRKRLEFLNKL